MISFIVCAMTDAPKTQKNNKKDKAPSAPAQPPEKQQEIGGREGLDPTRYGDWEVNGKCVDF